MMEDTLEKLMGVMSKKKGKRMLSDSEKEASLSVLEDLRKIAEDEQLDGMFQAKIASNSPEGLKKGAELLEEKVEGMEQNSDEYSGEDESEEEDESDMGNDAAAMMEEKVEDFSGLSEEELDAQIERLQKLREKKKLSNMF